MQLHWHTEPFLLITLLGIGWLYAILLGPMRSRFQGAPAQAPRREIWAFYTSLIISYLTVASPLDQIGEQFLFSAHMIQHMLLVYVCPPLAIVGLPAWLTDEFFRNPICRRVFGFLFNPVAGGLIFSATYTIWHIPGLYEWALQDKTVHIIEHLTMYVTGWMMLWGFFSRSRVLPVSPYGVRMIAVFLLMVAQLPVFAFLTLSDTVLYPTYEWAPRIIPGFTAIQDQVLGGLIMKVSNMFFSIITFCVVFYIWVQKERSDDLAFQAS
ncbi:MAG: cytochrome c oxidase assembly protein [Verrucomicrobiota bacterium]